MRRLLAALLAALFASANLAADPPGGSVVLIVSASSPVARLEIIEVRRLFLGLTVNSDGLTLRALENGNDERLHEVFLQNVIGMPDDMYERRLLRVTLQQGGRRPKIYASTSELLNAVAADPGAVSIAWMKDVAGDKRIKILRVLWRD